MKKLLTWGAVALGVLLVLLAVYYWITPAGSLAPFVPGYEPGVTSVHIKHGLAALILAMLLFIYAWFSSGSQRSSMSANPPAATQ